MQAKFTLKYKNEHHNCVNSQTTWNNIPVAPPGFCNRGEVRYGSIGGLEYEVPQSRLYCLCINMALCSTALQCICHVIRRSYMTMKAHTYYIIFGRPPIGGEASPLPPGSATVTYHKTIHDTRCYFNLRLKADMSQLNLPHGSDNWKV